MHSNHTSGLHLIACYISLACTGSIKVEKFLCCSHQADYPDKGGGGIFR